MDEPLRVHYEPVGNPRLVGTTDPTALVHWSRMALGSRYAVRGG